MTDADEEMVRDAVLALAGDDEMRHVLRRAVAWEEEAPERKLNLGWESGEIPMGSSHVRKLRNALVIRVTYSSSNSTHYALVDREATKQALDDFQQGNTAPVEPVPDNVRGRFQEIAAQGNALAYLARRVAPDVKGLEREKKALVLSLASADDRAGSRGRVHTLFWGPEGTAKTELLLWASKALHVPIHSPRVTEAKLTVDLRDGAPGALPRAHHEEFSTVIVDELEKAPKEATQHMLQALEEGEFSFPQGHGTKTLEAEVRFLGAANRLGSFSPEFLDRIDFLMHVDQPGKDDAKQIMDHVIDRFMVDEEEGTAGVMRHYLRWIRDWEPSLKAPTRRAAKRAVRGYIDKDAEEDVRVRRYEAVLRVAYTIARLNRADVTPEHVDQAAVLLNPEWGRETKETPRQATGEDFL